METAGRILVEGVIGAMHFQILVRGAVEMYAGYPCSPLYTMLPMYNTPHLQLAQGGSILFLRKYDPN